MARIKQLLIFLITFALILVASHYYMFERISYYLQLNSDQKLATAYVFFCFSFLTLVAIPLSRQLPRTAAGIVSWIIYPWMGFALLLFATLVATDIVWLIVKLCFIDYISEPSELLQRDFGIAAISITLLLGLYALANGMRPVPVKSVSVTLDRLPQSLDGLRIVQITDLHIGPLIGGNWLKHIVDRVNALKPDVIVITGDLMDGSVKELRDHVAALASLRAPHGIYFITGNHEYYSGVEEWCTHIKNLGITVLRNERVSIGHDEKSSFDLAGVDDWASHHFPGGGADLPKALAGRDPHKILILLAHQPKAIEEAAEHGVDLQLSGHTHGGQIWPFTYLVRLQQPYTRGLYRHKDTQTQLYVSAGTGFWGPPMRLGTSSEITHITLRASHASSI